ncbi:MAG: hypothetical protein V3V08_20460 [Nannocystaceae bacterium]
MSRRPMEETGPRSQQKLPDTDQLIRAALEDLVQESRGHRGGAMLDEEAHRQDPRSPHWLVGVGVVFALLVLLVGGLRSLRGDESPGERVAAVVSASVMVVDAPVTSRAVVSAPSAAQAMGAETDADADSVLAVDGPADVVSGPVAELSASAAAASPVAVAGSSESAPADADSRAESRTAAPSRGRRSKRRRGSKPSSVSVGGAGKAVAVPPPGVRAEQKAAAPPAGAAGLLKAAKKALAAGKAARAYDLARRSRDKKKSQGAIYVMGRAACQLGDAAKAKAAVRRLSFRKSRDVRRECRQRGVRLGL